MSDRVDALARALKAADAAGNTEDARKLAQALAAARSSEPSRPEGMSAEDAQAARDAPFWQRAGVSLSQGVPFVGEYTDEALGAVFGDDTREYVRDIQDINAYDNPGWNTAGQLAGGVAATLPLAAAAAPVAAGMRGASLASNVFRGALAGTAAGATEGAVSGYGAGEGETRGRKAYERGLLGGALGGAVGAAAPAVAAGASRVARNVRLRPDAKAAREIGLSPESADVVGSTVRADQPGAIRRIRQGGDEAMLGDAGPSTAGLLDWSIQRSGGGGRVAREAIEGRAEQSGRTINQALDQALGGSPQLRARATYSPRTGELYERAYSQPINYAGRRGQEIESLLQRVPGQAVRRANELMRVEGVRSRQILADVADDGTVTFREMPDVRQLDYITRALNDVAQAADGQGAIGGTTAMGRAVGGLSRRIRDTLKDEVPAYREALSEAARTIGVEQAQDLGEAALRPAMTRSQLAQQLESLGREEMVALKRGIRSHIDDTIAKTRRTQGSGPDTDVREAMTALRNLSDRSTRDKLAMVLGDDAADTLTTKIDRAGRAFELRARTADNSKTFARQSADEAVENITEPGALGEMMSASPLEATRKLIQSMTNMTPAERQATQERIATEIATVLTSKRGRAAELTANRVIQMLNRREATEALGRRVGRIAGTTTVGAGYPLISQSTSR